MNCEVRCAGSIAERCGRRTRQEGCSQIVKHNQGCDMACNRMPQLVKAEEWQKHVSFSYGDVNIHLLKGLLGILSVLLIVLISFCNSPIMYVVIVPVL